MSYTRLFTMSGTAAVGRGFYFRTISGAPFSIQAQPEPAIACLNSLNYNVRLYFEGI